MIKILSGETPSDRAYVRFFVRGLHQSYRSSLGERLLSAMRDCSIYEPLPVAAYSPDRFRELVQREAKYLGIDLSSKPSTGLNESPVIRALQHPVNTPTPVPNSTGRKSGRHPKRPTKTCHFCKKPGHLMRACPDFADYQRTHSCPVEQNMIRALLSLDDDDGAPSDDAGDPVLDAPLDDGSLESSGSHSDFQ